MHKVLLAIDGSHHSSRAAGFLVTLIKEIGAVEVILLNVQPEPEFRALALHRDVILAELRENSDKALAEARRLLDTAGIAYKPRLEFGNVAQAIVRIANEEGCEQIIMGTRGLGALAGLLLGSVATKVLHLAEVPVVLVK